MPSGSGEKTEKATPKRRREQRRKGNVPVSKDVIVVASLLISFWCIQLFFPIMYESLRDIMNFQISSVSKVDDLTIGNLRQLGMLSVNVLVKSIIPLGLISMAVGIITTGIQTKFLFTMKPLKFKLSKLNPLKGIKKFVSIKNIIEVLKSLVKLIILAVIVYQILKDEIILIAQTMDMNPAVGFSYILKEVIGMIFKIVMVFAAIAFFDFFYQRWSHEKGMRMSKEEIKEEYKQTEGNPQIKSRIRSLQQSMARSRMMQAVPDADVIIRNPTHYAVALKYDIDHDNAPVLVAKGQDLIALKIVEIAEESGVTVIENKPLARGIYASTPLNGEIPAEYYGVVAEILVKVFRMNKKLV